MNTRNSAWRDQPVIAYSPVQLSIKKVVRAVCRAVKTLIASFVSPVSSNSLDSTLEKHLVCPELAQIVTFPLLQHSYLCCITDYP